MKYLFPKQLLYLHKRIIEETGGSGGVRDISLLESAAYRPQATFGGEDLYPDLISKAAAMGHSIISNHPFVDGNKRAGYEAMRILLRLNDLDIKASENIKYAFVIDIAKGKLSLPQITTWLRSHSK